MCWKCSCEIWRKCTSFEILNSHKFPIVPNITVTTGTVHWGCFCLQETVKRSPSRGSQESGPSPSGKKDSELEVILRRRRNKAGEAGSGGINTLRRGFSTEFSTYTSTNSWNVSSTSLPSIFLRVTNVKMLQQLLYLDLPQGGDRSSTRHPVILIANGTFKLSSLLMKCVHCSWNPRIQY